MPGIELLTNAQMSEADRLTIAKGIPGRVLMEHAGAAVADAARQAMPRGGRKVVVLCGPGNNGGDGFVAARLLKDMGYSVSAGLLGKLESLSGDAAAAARAWTGRTGSAALVDLDSADLVIDALFGAGLARDLDGRTRAIVERLNQWRAATGKPVIAVDVPSGLDGNSGQVRGVCVEASVTVTFFRLKPGHILLPGRELCGRIRLEQIGISAEVLSEIGPRTFLNGPALWRSQLPHIGATGHKYSRGHALVVSGPMHQTGATRMSAMAALRNGAGLVTVASPRDALAVNAAHLTAIMLTPCDTPEELAHILADARKNAVVIGPGAGTGAHTYALVQTALGISTSPAVVLDADALTSFEGSLETLASSVKARSGPVVLTPHGGEFARLFGALDASKLERAREAAQSSSATVVYKGADTVVAHPDGSAAIARNAPPWLATAGSGDILAGMIAGLLAQGMPVFEAACAAVWMHGDAARRFGPGLIAEDLPALLPQVWSDLLAIR
jgi:hydroxyethylthiazole kinase-like uncharacterized protein yjeF